MTYLVFCNSILLLSIILYKLLKMITIYMQNSDATDSKDNALSTLLHSTNNVSVHKSVLVFVVCFVG
jgi:hypothetical protein